MSKPMYAAPVSLRSRLTKMRRVRLMPWTWPPLTTPSKGRTSCWNVTPNLLTVAPSALLCLGPALGGPGVGPTSLLWSGQAEQREDRRSSVNAALDGVGIGLFHARKIAALSLFAHP